MALAIVSEITRRFKSVVAKWQAGLDEALECRFLLREGFYVGHVLTWGNYRGIWFSDTEEMKVYRDQQWLMTMPVSITELENSVSISDSPAAVVRTEVRSTKSAA
ncbi:MAG: hypothetical protein JNL67_07340 [Planctomycetaceae bacterium]|nr:hypothetical protein [Planctomycetaceae bacterium]